MSIRNLLMKNAAKYAYNASPRILTARHGHTIRGKPPGVAKTLEQRLQMENVQDPELTARVNIGLPKLRSSRSEQLKNRLQHLKILRANEVLEKQARSNNLVINMEQLQEEYRQTNGQFNLRIIADYFGIFEHLFGCAYFVPRVVLNIQYQIDTELNCPVYHGNIIKPAEAVKQPQVQFDGITDPITGEIPKSESYWTLIATNPDGNFTDSNAEYIHWFVSNIPNGDFARGDVLVNYLPPFPSKGIGYQRFIFLLYKQSAKLDFSAYKINENDNKLERRIFRTLDFYRQYQDDITPAGLAFFQTDWDKTVTKFYHEVLQMKEPIFEYDFEPPYVADQKFFPLKQAFNTYMDRHRDIMQVNQEYLERKLVKTHPFDGPAKPLRFPNAHSIRDVPSWLRTEIRKERLRIGRVNEY